MLAVKLVVHGLVEFIQNFSKKNHDTPQVWEKKRRNGQTDASLGLQKFLCFSLGSRSPPPFAFQPQPNSKYKTSMCRDLRLQGGCPRGSSCTFAHTQDELEK